MANLSTIAGGSIVRAVYNGAANLNFGSGVTSVTIANPATVGAKSLLVFTAHWMNPGPTSPVVTELSGSPGMTGVVSGAILVFAIPPQYTASALFQIAVAYQVVEFN